ncbi:MAG: response regulator transcription factor [Bacteroidota bacterium]|nr:response regulator transcription factor [Bacteroidota bacterium]
MPAKANVVLVDDHSLLRNGLASLIKSFGEYNILFEADNGQDFIDKLKPKTLPQVVLMDINMPEMDGYEACLWLKNNYPEIKVLALSMYDNENSVIRMFKAGAKGYILKDCDPAELRLALQAVITKGFYYSEMVTGKLIHTINTLDEEDSQIKNMIQLNEREINFLKLVCTEFTYKEIAEKMFLSPRTIDGYRDELFQKLNVKTRVGLVMYAIKNGIVNV